MPFAAGDHLGPYTVVGPLGSGGMGEVYRARDARLGRDVALKILPVAFAHDSDRLARFQREAQVLASLNHPNIGGIYGIEEGQSEADQHVRALVLELVEGPTLADRIAQGPIPVDEALAIARQIADGLEAAHDHGIIHRDLKPANIKLRPDGTVKVLDFGLAKPSEPSSSVSGVSMSPTITSPAMTMGGVILGTAAYMSPEQAKGKPVDRRADVWAFGCVIYEMLTGSRAFAAEDVSETLAFVLTKDPDWSRLPTAISPSLRVMIQRCVAKDPKSRVRSAGDVRLAIDGEFEVAVPAPSVGLSPWVVAAALAAAIICAGAGRLAVWYTAVDVPSAGVRRLTLALPLDAPLRVQTLNGLAISPDGRRVVYVADVKPNSLLYLRELSQADAIPLRGTEGASRPFFSPDGESIAFFADRKLKKIAATGGAASIICDTGEIVYGGSWGVDDLIVFSSTPITGETRRESILEARLFKVSASQRKPQLFTVVDSETSFYGEVLPGILPGGKAVLFTQSGDNPNIAVASLDSGRVQVIGEGLRAKYVASGHLVYAADTLLLNLVGLPFDLRTLRATGPPFPLLEGTTSTGNLMDVSEDGVLVYGGPAVTNSLAPRSLVWVDRAGTRTVAVREARPYRFPSLSNDGRHVSVGIVDDIWVIDLERQSSTRLTNEDRVPALRARAGVGAPVPTSVWTPDSKRITFSSMTSLNSYALEWTNADGSGGRETLMRQNIFLQPGGWTPDGNTLVFYQLKTAEHGRDIWMFQRSRKSAQSLVETRFQERAPRLSPDGRWLAFVSNSSGRDQVYVRSFPQQIEQKTVSSDGGGEPLWSRDGRELFYRRDNQVFVVDVKSSPTLTVSPARVLFEGPYATSEPGGQIPNYDIAPDGKRFLMVAGESSSPPQVQNLSVVLNWFEELKLRASAR
jgi:serine/threonine-protein kinase